MLNFVLPKSKFIIILHYKVEYKLTFQLMNDLPNMLT